MKINIPLLSLLFMSKGFQANEVFSDEASLKSNDFSEIINISSEGESQYSINDLERYSSDRRQLTVFPPDGRVQYDPYNYQRGLGLLSYLEDNIKKYCTATLVDREFILTAASCVYKDNLDANGKIISRSLTEEWKKSMKFQFGYTDGHPGIYNSGYKKAFAPNKYITVSPDWKANNFAVVQLSDALGDVTKYMFLTKKDAKSYTEQGVSLVSFMYKNDATASADYCCEIIGNENGRVKHNCDTTYGSDGAPLYVQIPDNKPGEFKYNLVAMNNEQGKDFNLAAATAPISALLDYAKKNVIHDRKYIRGTPWKTTGNINTECDWTESPTSVATRKPTKYPISKPTIAPTTKAPVPAPTQIFILTKSPTPPTLQPTADLTPKPTTMLTRKPTRRLTAWPTQKPTADSTPRPTQDVTPNPTADSTPLRLKTRHQIQRSL